MGRYLFGLAQAAVCGLMMGLVLLVGGHCWRPAAAQAADDVPGVVKAHTFLAVDIDGEVRATLDGTQGFQGVHVFDKHGERASLRIGEDNLPRLSLQDAGGKIRAALRLNDADCPQLSLKDDTGKGRADLELDENGLPGLFMYRTGNVIGMLLTDHGVGFNAANGANRITLGMKADGSPRLLLHDAAGKLRAGQEVRGDGTPRLFLCDTGETIFWQAP